MYLRFVNDDKLTHSTKMCYIIFYFQKIIVHKDKHTYHDLIFAASFLKYDEPRSSRLEAVM